jgi:long-subunit fatty acid transport protein
MGQSDLFRNGKVYAMKLFGLLALGVFFAQASKAQDNHYDFYSLGVRTSLLNGAGIARQEDEMSVYYNPAHLGTATKSSLSFNSAAFSFQNIKFEDVLGDNYTIKTSGGRFLPSVIAGIIKLKENQNDWSIGYAIIHRNFDKLKLNSRTEETLNVINDAESPGNEEYIGAFNRYGDLDDVAVIGGVGYKLNEHWSIGTSLMFNYRSHIYREDFNATLIPTNGLNGELEFLSTKGDFGAEYNQLAAQLKLGVAYTHKNFDIGISVTTPSVKIFGKGDISAEYSFVNYRPEDQPNVPRQSLIASARVEDIKSKFKYPLQVSVGASTKIKNVRLYAAGNFYSSIDEYSVMDPDQVPFVRPTSSDNLWASEAFLRIWDKHKSVINTALAFDWDINKTFSLLGSFRSDRGYASVDEINEYDGRQIYAKFWNNRHFIGGLEGAWGRFNIIAGIQYSHGSNDQYPQPINLKNPQEDGLLLGEGGYGAVKMHGLSLLLSYSIKF